MNIFKILASGDGSINEPNVSAFLGYLLNPKADHGIGDELLKKVLFYLYESNQDKNLSFLIDKHKTIRNLSLNSNFNIEVLLEQAFKIQGEKKEVVDIVILCFEKTNQQKESIANFYISNSTKGELKQVFLIENKIRDGATREEQLKKQYSSTVSLLSKMFEQKESDINKMLSIIFISPDGKKSNNEYEELEIEIPKVQLHWNKSEEDEVIDGNTITFFLRQILLDEAGGRIEAINEQTKFTIKSFIAFVENDFKSSLEEELGGEIIREIDYDFSEFKTKQKSLFSEKAWSMIEKFQDHISIKYPNLFQRHSPTHPVSVFIKEIKSEKVGKKIMSLTRIGKEICLQLVYRNNTVTEIQKSELNKLLREFHNISDIKDTEKIFILKLKNTITLGDIFRIFEVFYNMLFQ